MYIDIVPNRGSPPAILLRESIRDGKRVRKPKTLLPQVEKVRASFGIDRLVTVGDRGMISNVQIDAIAKLDGVDWITALKSGRSPSWPTAAPCSSTCSTGGT